MDNKTGEATIGCLAFIVLVFIILLKLIDNISEQYQKQHQARIKVCEEKEYINTSMCRELLFDEKVEQVENSSENI